MSTFHIFQRVRIVGVFQPVVRHLIGSEGFVVGPGESMRGVIGYVVRIPDKPSPIDSGHWFFTAEQMEPIKYLPAPEDFASIEGLPNFDCPVRDPAVSAEGVA